MWSGPGELPGSPPGAVPDQSPLPIDHEQLLGVETAFVYGPFSLQAEWYGDFVNGLGGRPNHTFHGASAPASYF